MRINNLWALIIENIVPVSPQKKQPSWLLFFALDRDENPRARYRLALSEQSGERILSLRKRSSLHGCFFALEMNENPRVRYREWYGLIEESFLPDDMKLAYWEQIESMASQL